MKRVRVGNGCGFWGDNLDAPIRLAEAGQLDYLTLEYLAELTMSILALLKKRDTEAGYATDFLDVLLRLTPSLKLQPKLKIVTNAGGMNPQVCGRKSREILHQVELGDRKVAVVSGDDLMPELQQLIKAGHALNHLDDSRPLDSILARVVSANAYLGARPIAEALKLGADVVVTGRVADASLTLGPLVHEFGWLWNDWNRLGAGTTAGHLIECGAQATGALWTRADASTRLADVGYPIADVTEDGVFRITKPDGSGGVINEQTVTEQLLYEVADPSRYLTPDVVADFTGPSLAEIGSNLVEIRNCRGTPSTDSYKVSIAYRDGYTSAGMLVIPGPRAGEKARLSGQIILDRLKTAGFEFAASHIEALGTGESVPGVLPTCDPPEVVLRVAVRDTRKAAVERFTKEFAPLVTAGFAGTTGYTTGRPQVREVFAFWPALIAKSAVTPRVELL